MYISAYTPNTIATSQSDIIGHRYVICFHFHPNNIGQFIIIQTSRVSNLDFFQIKLRIFLPNGIIYFSHHATFTSIGTVVIS